MPTMKQVGISSPKEPPTTAFWVTKYGLKMSGMPAWGLGHDDAAIWSIVAFVTKLPGLSSEHYKDMVARAPPDEETETMKKPQKGSKPAGIRPEEKGEQKH